VSAAGLGDFVCDTPESYARRAVELALAPAELAQARRRLRNGRSTCLLFDTPKLVAHLEDLYREMWADYEGGRLPVPDLHNLEVYREIGVGLLTGDTVPSDADGEYRALYAMKRAEWNAVYPLDQDRFSAEASG
jgi:hypothetical protein